MTWLRITVRRAVRGPGLPAAVAAALTVAVAVVALAGLSGRPLLDAAMADALRTAAPADAVTEVGAAATGDAADDAVRAALAVPAAGCACPALQVDRALVTQPLAAGDDTGPRLIAWVAPDLPGHARLTSGRWPAAGPARTLGAALHEGAARTAGIRVGDRILLPGRGDQQVPVEIVGLWRPRDPADRFWAGGRLELSGAEGNAVGPLLLAGGEPPGDLDGEWRSRWRVSPTAQVTHRADLRTLIDALAQLPRRLAATGAVPEADVDGRLPALLEAERTRLSRASVAVDVLLFLDLMLAGVLVTLTATLAAQARAAENRLLRARGASAGQRLRVSLFENVLPAVLAAGLGALAAGAALARTVPAAGTAPATVLAVAGGLALATGLGVGLLVHLVRDGVSGRAAAAPAVAAAAVVAAVAGWQLEQAGPVPVADPVLVAAPGALLLGAAVAGVRLLRPATRAGAALGRLRGLTGALVGWSLARRAVRPATSAVALVAAIATAVVALAGLASSAATVTVRTARDVPGDVVLRLTDGSDPARTERFRGLAEVLAAVPGQAGITPATVYDGSVGPLAVPVVALDTTTAAAVAGQLPPVPALRPPAPRDTAVPLPAGRDLALDVLAGPASAGALAAADPGLPPALTATLLLGDRYGVIRTVPLPTVPADGRPRTARVRLPAGGLSLTGLRLAVENLRGTAQSARVRVLRLTVDGTPLGALPGWKAEPFASQEETSTDPDQIGPAEAGVADPGGDLLRVDLGGPRQTLQALAVAATTIELPARVPAVVAAGTAERLGLRPGEEFVAYAGGRNLQLVLAGTLGSIPGTPAGGDGVLVDSRQLGLHGLDGRGILPQPQAWWVRAAPGTAQAALAGTLASAAGRAGVAVTTATQDARRAQLRGDPLVLGLRRLLQALLAICAAVVLAALLLADAVAARARRGEIAALRAVGISPAQVRRATGGEQVLVVGTIVLLGVLVGAALAPLAVPSLLGPLVLATPASTDGTGTVLEAGVRAAPPWPAVAVIVAVVVAAAGTSALRRGVQAARMAVPDVLREGVR